VLGGRDVAAAEAGSPVNDDGVVATIVNGLDRLGPLAERRAAARSCCARCASVTRARRHARSRHSAHTRYRGFTLLVADRETAFAVTSDERALRVDALAPGHQSSRPRAATSGLAAYAAHFDAFRTAAPPDPSRDDWAS